MAVNAVYQINASARNYVGSITIMGGRLNMQHNYQNNASDAILSKLDNRYKSKFSLWTTYYSA